MAALYSKMEEVKGCYKDLCEFFCEDFKASSEEVCGYFRQLIMAYKAAVV